MENILSVSDATGMCGMEVHLMIPHETCRFATVKKKKTHIATQFHRFAQAAAAVVFYPLHIRLLRSRFHFSPSPFLNVLLHLCFYSPVSTLRSFLMSTAIQIKCEIINCILDVTYVDYCTCFFIPFVFDTDLQFSSLVHCRHSNVAIQCVLVALVV